MGTTISAVITMQFPLTYRVNRRSNGPSWCAQVYG